MTRKELLIFYFEQEKEIPPEHVDLFVRTVPLISAINEYDEQLEHLEMLISSFQSFHKDENDMNIEGPDHF